MKQYVIGCDSIAIHLKDDIKGFLVAKGISIEDKGCFEETETDNYPSIAKKVCDDICSSKRVKRGILICGTGIGMAITANKFRGIRAAVCHDTYSAERFALSNDGNILCLGARVIGAELAKKIIMEWVGLEYMDGPSTPKIDEILAIEANNMI